MSFTLHELLQQGRRKRVRLILVVMLRKETRASVDNEAYLWQQVNIKVQKFPLCRQHGAGPSDHSAPNKIHTAPRDWVLCSMNLSTS